MRYHPSTEETKVEEQVWGQPGQMMRKQQQQNQKKKNEFDTLRILQSPMLYFLLQIKHSV